MENCGGLNERYGVLLPVCITTARFSILIEGQPLIEEEFQSGKGFQREDPLSSTIFNLVVEVLSQGFNRATKEREIDTYTMSEAKSTSHLVFAYDLHIIFTKANYKSLSTLKSVLQQ